MALIELNGESLGYDRAGAGEKLLLIHSLGTAAWMWREQIRRWSSSFDVIAVDARGHGRSSRRGGFTVRNVASDLAAVLEAFGRTPAASSPFPWVGRSPPISPISRRIWSAGW